MHYYVDGYNLLFGCMYTGQELSKERQRLIDNLNEKAGSLGISIALFFDGCHTSNIPSRSHYKHLEILFSGKGQTADQLIVEYLGIRSSKIRKTVVTSDRALAVQARQCGALTLSIEEFVALLNAKAEKKRRKKEHPPEHLPPPKQEPTPTRSKSPPPPTASVTECFQYYLESFEEKLKKKKI